MLKFSILITLVALFTAYAFEGLSDDDMLKLKDHGLSTGTGLAKTSKSAIALTQYFNPSVNLSFTVPNDWYITDTIGFSGFCLLVLSNSYATASVFIVGWKENTVYEATRHGPSNCFYDNWSSSKLSIFVPYLSYVYDTTINNVRYAHNQIKDKDASNTNTITHIRTRFTQSNTVYYHSMYYRTTISDYNINETIYNSNWLNLLFIYSNPSTVAKTVAPLVVSQDQLSLSKSAIHVNLIEQQSIKLQVFDIQGRLLKHLYSGVLDGKKDFDLGRLSPPYIVNLKASISENKLVLPLK